MFRKSMKYSQLKPYFINFTFETSCTEEINFKGFFEYTKNVFIFMNELTQAVLLPKHASRREW